MTKNFDDLDKHLDKLISTSESRVVKVYSEANKFIRKQLADMYEKFEVNGSLTLADMTVYNRLRKQLDTINAELVGVYNQTFKLAQGTMEEQYLENYFRTAFLLEFETQKRLGFQIVNPVVIEAMINNPISGLTLKEILEKNRNAVVYKLQQEITSGLIHGESYSKMMKRVVGVLDGDLTKAQRVVRTEAGRAQSLARNDSIEQAQKYSTNITKVWDATLDTHTRKRHQQLDGKEADQDGFFTCEGYKAKAPRLFGVASLDINCRCSVRPQVNGRQPSVRRARNEDGTTSVIPWTNYEDWYKNRINKGG
jgi:SPP1 gp7 family putative phage head morphogenesis protein